MSTVPFYAVLALIGLAAIYLLTTAIYLFVSDYLLIREIKRSYNDQGKTWSYWTNWPRRSTLFWHPQLILQDEPEIGLAAKKRWLDNRLQLNSRFFKAALVSFGLFLSAVGLLLVLGLVLHKHT